MGYVPEGRWENGDAPGRSVGPGSPRPYGTDFLFLAHPALKDRATLPLLLRGKEGRRKRWG